VGERGSLQATEAGNARQTGAPQEKGKDDQPQNGWQGVNLSVATAWIRQISKGIGKS
jgi:hypothetical protein